MLTRKKGDECSLSVSGTMAMAVLRLIHPGKGSFSDEAKCREQMRRENERFVFRMPTSRKANFSIRMYIKTIPRSVTTFARCVL